MNVISRLMAASAMVVCVAVAPAAQAETLADTLIAAYKESNLLEQNRALLRAADEDVAIAVAQLRPVVQFTTQATYTNSETLAVGGTFPNTFQYETTTDTLTAGAQLSWDLTLMDSGRGRLAVEAAKETVLATRAALMDIEQRVLVSGVQAYVNVWLAQQYVSLRQSNVRLISQELDAANDRFEVGEITRTDVALAQARLASSRAELASSEGELAIARESYKAVTGAYPKALAGLPAAPSVPKSMADAIGVAVRTHPSLLRAQHEVAAADINVARAEAGMKPTLTGRAVVALNPGGVESEQLQLNFNQTLYAGGQLRAVLRRAKAQQQAQRANLMQAVVGIEQAVGNAWSSLDVYGASLSATSQQITAAQTAFDGTREEAKLGARTTLDVLNAEQELLDARASRLAAEANRYFAVYTLLQSMGLLTVEHLKLGIPTYDVTAYYNAVKDAPEGFATSKQGRDLDRVLKAIGADE